MPHPHLEKEISSEMSNEDIQKKILELYKKMGMAHLIGNKEMIVQLQLFLDHYEEIQDERLRLEMEEMIASDPELNKVNRISVDIEWPDPVDEDNTKEY